MTTLTTLARRAGLAIAVAALSITAGTTWLSSTPALAAPATKVTTPTAAASPTDDDAPPAPHRGGKSVSGKVNLNTATADQLVLLPGVGPSKADRIVAFRTKHGPFKRVADLRRVKGFGYKSLKKLEAFLDVKGDTTLRAD